MQIDCNAITSPEYDGNQVKYCLNQESKDFTQDLHGQV